MSTSRRRFLETSVAACGTFSLGIPVISEANSTSPSSVRQTASPLRILILGGTSYIGPHQVRYALERGHSVSIFTRGNTQPTMFSDAFDQVEHLVGDRANNLDALRGRTWDVVIDNSGQRIEWARDSAQLLRDSAERYLYVSSTGVYYPYLTTNIREDTPLILADDPPQERPSYGVMKSLSEIEVQQAFGDRALVVRPQYILGPGDRTGRSAFWPVRIQHGGEVVVPGRKADPVMLIDVRDLTEWMIHLLEDGTTGTFNAAGPAAPLTMEEFIHGVRATTSSSVSWAWIDDYGFLKEHRYTYAIPWVMVEGDNLGSARINIDRALANGLTHRPYAKTLTDIYEWWYSNAVSDERRLEPRFPITLEREAEVLADWRARNG